MIISSITLGEITCYSVIIVMAVLFLKTIVNPLNKFMTDINPLSHKKEISNLNFKISELNFEIALLRAEINKIKSEIKNENGN
jgi:peptidoglycan hydrolase CwlO-like protein